MPDTIDGRAIPESPLRLPAEICDRCGHSLQRIFPTLAAAGARLASLRPRVACPNGCVCWEWVATLGWMRLTPERKDR